MNDSVITNEDTLTYTGQTINIGSKVWTSENLNIDDGGDGIYRVDGNTFYTYEAAQRICSKLKNWRLPTLNEWQALIRDFGGVPQKKQSCSWSTPRFGSFKLTSTDLEYDFRVKHTGIILSNGGHMNSFKTCYWVNSDPSNFGISVQFPVDKYSRDGMRIMQQYVNISDWTQESAICVRLVKDTVTESKDTTDVDLPIIESYINECCTLEVVDGKEYIGEHFKKYMKKKKAEELKKKKTCCCC